MSKIVVIPNSKKNIKNISNCSLLLGIDGYNVNTLNVSLNELKELLLINKNIYISLNKNFVNKELTDLENLLKLLMEYNVKGIFYYDVAVFNIVKRLKLNLELVWSSEHLTTNYYTINYWYNAGVKATFLSNEITMDEIIDISKNTKSKLFVQLFGYIPMYVSRRHAIKNYLRYFNVVSNNTNYQLYKEDKVYPIIDNNEGTMIYSNFILNGLEEYLNLKDKVDYVLINGYNIDSSKFLEVISMFESVNDNNILSFNDKLKKMFSHLDKGFLYKETVYKVKKND